MDHAPLSLPWDGLPALIGRIDAGAGAYDGQAAAATAQAIRDACAGLVGQHLGGAVLARVLAQLNDRLVARIIRQTADEHRLPPVAWAWLALGSEGRYEQTFVTDQDNGLMFSATDGREAEALRALFLPFARQVNERLDQCGFTYCAGGVMAGNPQWCLSLDEWEEQFADWVRRPEPLALMHGTIFFDFRILLGDADLGRRLRQHLAHLTSDSPAFLRLMAANALEAEVPLSFLGDISVSGPDRRLDIKKFGTRIFVDAARIFALATGSSSVETRCRLLECGLAAGLQADESAAARDAFSHLLRLRLESQAAALARGQVTASGIDPQQLHELDRGILREALKQARRLQQRLKLNYLL